MRQPLCWLLICLLLVGCASAPAPSESTVSPAASDRSAAVFPTTSVPNTPAAPTETTALPDPLAVLLADMTLAQKVGQLFICYPEQLLPGRGDITAMSDALDAAIAQYPVGGFILFSVNIRSPNQLQALNRSLADACDIPPFLCVDEEGGWVARLANHEAFDLPRYQNAAAVGASGNPAAAQEMGRTIGVYLREYGFNVNFAPVADVNTNPSNPVIGTRAFSDQPEVAARMAAAFAAGLREEGICATFKHFPGHGDTNQDSHTGLAVSYRSREELESCEWLPFREATALDLVMTAHVALPEITGDMTPSTLSPQVVTGILREDLMFEGLIVTDAMGMGAIVDICGSGEAAVMALKAGCDIILIPENLPEAFDAVLATLADGTLSPEWLDETVYRILAFKQLHGIL